jgi:hypothetical protein
MAVSELAFYAIIENYMISGTTGKIVATVISIKAICP